MIVKTDRAVIVLEGLEGVYRWVREDGGIGCRHKKTLSSLIRATQGIGNIILLIGVNNIYHV